MATSAEVFDEIKASLLKNAEITNTERCFNNLDTFINEALIKYTEEDTTDFSTLHVLERRLVMLLSWIAVCYARASGYAPQPSQRAGSNVGFGYGSDRDTPYKKCMDLAAKLKEEYEELKAEFEEEFGLDDEDGDGASGDVQMGEIVRRESHISAMVPPVQATAVPVRMFYSKAAGAGEALLGWSKFTTSEFTEAHIFISPSANIREKWNMDGKDGIPFVSAAATKVYSTTDFIAKEVKLTGLASGTWYFVMVTHSVNDLYGFSNELTVVVT